MNWKYIIYSLLLLACVSSCNEEFEAYNKEKGDGTLQLIAAPPANYKQTRATDEINTFVDQTKFYLYATKTGTDGNEDWNINYLLKTPNSDSEKQDALAVGVAKADQKLGTAVRIGAYTNSTAPDRAELYSIASKFNDKPLNLYGVVAASNSEEERLALEDKYSRSHYTFYRSDGKPAALLMSHYAKDENGKDEATHTPLPDFMWSGSLKNLTPYNNSGDIIMPFSHVLSKLRFHAIYLDEKTETSTRPEIIIKGLRIWDYKEGLLNFATGLFNYNYDNTDTDLKRDEWVNIELPEDGVKPTVKEDLIPDESEDALSSSQLDQFRLPNPFAIARIFPTYNTLYDNTFDSDLDDKEPGVPVSEATISDDHAVKIEITYTMNGEEKTLSAPLKLTNKNFAFAPNHEYDIVLTLTSTSVVVAIVPLYYEYIPEAIELDDYEIGEPIDFGGVLWAAENLGATSANPLANAEAWERSRGFYYQYGRNIPYYARGSVLDPYPDVAVYGDGSTTDEEATYYIWDYETARHLYTDGRDNIHIPYGPAENYNMHIGHGSRAYPYIPVLWEDEIKNASGSTKEEKEKNGYKAFLKNYRFYSSKSSNGQTDPPKNFSDPYIANYIISKNYTANSVVFSAYYEGSGRYWKDNNAAQPKNWYDLSGNNESDPCPKGWRLPKMNEFLSIFPLDQACGDISFNPDKSDANNVLPNLYPGGFLHSTKDENGDEDGHGWYIETREKDYNDNPAVYVGIYRDGEGYNDLATSPYTEGWGSIYAIKEQGTEAAYAIRWQIKIVGYDPATGKQTEKNVEPVDPVNDGEEETPYIGRGVLAISKYELARKYKNKLSLHYRTPKNGETEHIKGAQYKCIAFEDTDGDRTKDDNETTEYNIDWDHPDGIMYLPITGYVIVPSSGGQALLYPGREVLYWASDIGSHKDNKVAGVAVRIKYSGDYRSRHLYYTTSEYIANGCHIRPVRDTRAEIR